jgi:hypothetical protein
MDNSTGQPKRPVDRERVEKAHGRYGASEAKEGRPGRLPSSHAPGKQPKPPEKSR